MTRKVKKKVGAITAASLARNASGVATIHQKSPSLRAKTKLTTINWKSRRSLKQI